MLQSFLCKLSKCMYNLKNVKLVCDLITFLVTGLFQCKHISLSRPYLLGSAP